MTYKVLLIKNRFNEKLNFKEGLDWFKKNSPIEIKLDEMETDFDLVFDDYGNATYKGVGIAGSEKDKLRPLVPRNTYHAVVLIYGNKAKGVRVSVTNNSPLFPETEFIQLAKNDGKTLNHELFHSFFKRLKRKGIHLDDPMDKVTISGKVYPYYRDNLLSVKTTTNRTIALDRLKPYWSKVCEIGILGDVLNAIIPPKETKKYKYFKDNEIVGLQPSFVKKLDKAREVAGIPFVITSGYRTVAKNEEVGGVANSFHTQGLAVDIRCRNSEECDKIVKGANAADIKEKTVYTKSQHVHLADDPKVATLSVLNK